MEKDNNGDGKNIIHFVPGSKPAEEVRVDKDSEGASLVVEGMPVASFEKGQARQSVKKAEEFQDWVGNTISDYEVDISDLEEGLDTRIFSLHFTLEDTVGQDNVSLDPLKSTVRSIVRHAAQLKRQIEKKGGNYTRYTDENLFDSYPLDLGGTEKVSIRQYLEDSGMEIPQIKELEDEIASEERNSEGQFWLAFDSHVYEGGEPEKSFSWFYRSDLKTYMPKIKEAYEEDGESMFLGFINSSKEPALALLISRAAQEITEEDIPEVFVYRALDVMAADVEQMDESSRSGLAMCLDYELGKLELTPEERSKEITYSELNLILSDIFFSMDSDPLISMDHDEGHLVASLNAQLLNGLRNPYRKIMVDFKYYKNTEALEARVLEVVDEAFSKFSNEAIATALELEEDQVEFGKAQKKKEVINAYLLSLKKLIESKG